MTTAAKGEGEQKQRKSKIEILKKGESTMYLGRLLNLNNPHDVEIDNRIKSGWKKFMNLKKRAMLQTLPLAGQIEASQRHGHANRTIRLRRMDNDGQQREIIKDGAKKNA